MMQFQVSPPKRLPQNQEFNNEIENRSSKPSYLILGPHAKVPKVHFQEVKLGKSRKEVLIIRNPTDLCVNLKFVKKPSLDFAFSCDLDAIITIPATEQISIEIVWTPAKEGHFFEACQLVNSLNGIKLSVQLLGICASPPPVFKARGLVKRRPLIGPPQSFNIKPSLHPHIKTDQAGKSTPIPVPLKSSKTKPDLPKNPCTPPGPSLLQSIENLSFPFTPEAPGRRETFVVEKDEKASDSVPKHCQNLERNPAFTGNEFKEPGENYNAPIPMAESTRGNMDEMEIEAVSQFNDFACPLPPDEEGDRRVTFVVEKDDGQIQVTGAIIVFDAEDEKLRDDIDEAMAELENLENLVLGY